MFQFETTARSRRTRLRVLASSISKNCSLTPIFHYA